MFRLIDRPNAAGTVERRPWPHHKRCFDALVHRDTFMTDFSDDAWPVQIIFDAQVGVIMVNLTKRLIVPDRAVSKENFVDEL